MPSPSDHSSSREAFVGDRYDRLERAAEVVAQDPAVCDAPFPFNGDGLRALVAGITRRRLLDHLADQHANEVVALVALDFHLGVGAVATRVHRLLDEAAEAGAPAYEALAVISGVAAVLALMVDTNAWLPTAEQQKG